MAMNYKSRLKLARDEFLHMCRQVTGSLRRICVFLFWIDRRD